MLGPSSAAAAAPARRQVVARGPCGGGGGGTAAAARPTALQAPTRRARITLPAADAAGAASWVVTSIRHHHAGAGICSSSSSSSSGNLDSSSSNSSSRCAHVCAASKDGKAPPGGSGGGGGKPPSGGGKGGGASSGKQQPRSSGGGSGGSSSGGAKGGKGNDRADASKADFSAYWSLRFREFFSGRRAYLEAARSRGDERPEPLRRVDAQIAEAQERLEQATQAQRDAARAAYEASVNADAQAVLDQLTPEQVEELRAAVADGTVLTAADRVRLDADAARAHLRSRAVKVFVLAPAQLRAAARAVVGAPFAFAAALTAATQAVFARPRYEAFLLSEGERVWAWRNRTENERWFWQVFFWDRLFIPVAFTLAYLYLVPNHIVWAVLAPMAAIYWQDGRLPTPANLQWWLIMVFGLYGKCWHQVQAALAFLVQWW